VAKRDFFLLYFCVVVLFVDAKPKIAWHGKFGVAFAFLL
jgi:hypothetical protein